MVNSTKVISLLKQGKNFSEVARVTGYARNTVKAVLHRYLDKQESYITMVSWGLSDKDKLDIIDSKAYGMSASQIAKDYGISISYVYKIIQRERDASR